MKQIFSFYFIGFLGSFLSNNLKTNQLEVNTDAQTSRSIARLKEPRDLFALPKDKDNECSQQTARWPTECQVCDLNVLSNYFYRMLMVYQMYENVNVAINVRAHNACHVESLNILPNKIIYFR